jgi:hypothetical protein
MLRRLRRIGLRKTAVGLRPLCGFSSPHFCGCWNASRSLISTAKTSYIVGTLCAIAPALVGKYLNKKWLTKEAVPKPQVLEQDHNTRLKIYKILQKLCERNGIEKHKIKTASF